MRWTNKIKNKPYHGDERIVKSFAILPITCINGETRWLEKVQILQKYQINPTGNWVNMAFVN